MATTAEALMLAAQHYQAGQAAPAEALCRHILRVDPADAYALHLLGLLAHQGRRWNEAIGFFRQALQLRPDLAEVHNSLGAVLTELGQLPEALRNFQEALRLKPDYSEALYNEGTTFRRMGRLPDAEASYRSALQLRELPQAYCNLAAVQVLQGRPAEAVASYEAALRCWPGYVDAQLSLGDLFMHLGRLEEAESCYRAALRLRPELPEAHNGLGTILNERGQYADALASLQQALHLRPDFAAAHVNLGNLFRKLGRAAEAEESYREARRLQPELPQPHNNLGLIFFVQGRFDEALACFQEALRLWPDFPEAHANLGDVHKALARLAEAEASYRDALRLQPNMLQAQNNLGLVLVARKEFSEAEAVLREAMRLWPNSAETRYNLGTLLAAQERQDEALEWYAEALRLQPDYVDALNNVAFVYREQGRLEDAISYERRAVALRPDLPFLHSNLLLVLHYPAAYDPEAVFTEHMSWARQIEGQVTRGEGRVPADRDANRRLRIGYVSGDFREHVMGRYSEAVIGAHDRSQVEGFCYAHVRKPDVCTERIRAVADHWRPVLGLSDAQAADLIQADRIDLLIDLSGHTADNRLGIFALKPAPVQLTHCGYPGGTGLSAIDYRLTDPYCDPPEQTDRWHVEKVVRLPQAHWCYAPPLTPELGPLPAQEPGAVTFASFNNLAKVTLPLLGLWAEILQALPRSRMMVQTGTGRGGDERVRTAFTKHGIESDRVTLVPRLSSEAYYRRYGEVDICLDTYPYTGCNTTADALWMGVPVVTRAGPSCVTRLGVSAMVLAGLNDLVTDSPATYVETAIRLAQNLPRLKELRAGLRGRVQRTLGNVERFTRQLETAYREMWQTYCQSSGS
jgi:predicted O-linked N-acetylglucosamine transferase (SPINDLY family)